MGKIFVKLGLLLGVFAVGVGCMWFISSRSSRSLPKTRQDWLDIIHRQNPDLCSMHLGVEIPEEDLVKQYPLAEGILTVVLCESAAYQQSFVAVYSDRAGQSHIVFFEEFMDGQERYENQTPTDLEYDPKTKMFATHAKARGAGDCGSAGTYLWDEQAKTAELVAYRYQPCQEPYQNPWPIIYHR